MPNRITVITTKERVYTLFNETIHFNTKVDSSEPSEELFKVLSEAKTTAFNLACTCASAMLCCVDRPNFTEEDVFGFHKLGQYI